MGKGIGDLGLSPDEAWEGGTPMNDGPAPLPEVTSDGRWDDDPEATPEPDSKAGSRARIRAARMALAPSDLLNRPPERAWLLAGQTPNGWPRGILPRGIVGILGGAGGVGKSNAALDLAVAVATGGAWFDAAGLFPVAEESRGGTVVILAGEDDGLEVSRRLWRTLRDRWPNDRERERKAAEVAARVVIFPFAGDPLVTVAEADQKSGGEVRRTGFGAALVEELAELAAEANAAGRPLALVVIDPLSRFLASGAEVDAAAATRSIQVAEEVAKLADKPCVLVVHHVTKAARFDPDGASANDIRGTSALTDGSRWTAILRSYTRDKSGAAKGGKPRVVTLPDVVELRVVKSNYAACPAALVLRRRDDGGLAPETDAERKEREAEEARDRRATATIDKPTGRNGGKPKPSLDGGV